VHLFRGSGREPWEWADLGWGFAGMWVGGLFGQYLHVSAHALAAAGSGLRIRSWAAGGNPALRLTVKGAPIQLGPFPCGERYGFASGRSPMTLNRYRRVVRAGGLANLLLAALATPLIFLGRSPVDGLACAFALLQLTVGLTSLFLRSGPKSDGSLLHKVRLDPLSGPLAGAAAVEALRQGRFAEAADFFRTAQQDPEDPEQEALRKRSLLSLLCLDGQFHEAAQVADELVSALAEDSPEAAELRGLQADSLLSAALQDGEDLEPESMAWCARWADAEPASSEAAAITHRRALLELARRNPTGAAALCLDAIAWLDAHPESPAEDAANRDIVVGTLVIAYARAGDVTNAEKWLAEVREGGPLHEAALRELGVEDALAVKPT
jgi:hypothetical protein